MTIVERLLARCNVNQETGCWEWTGRKSRSGYGQMAVCADGKERTRGVHRLSHACFIGPIPDWKCVLHRCDVKHCINPDHLFLGTNADNSKDMVSKGRQASGDRHGRHTHPERSARGESHTISKLTTENVKEIRARYAAGGITWRELGNKFGVTKSCIGYIICRKNWKHIQ